MRLPLYDTPDQDARFQEAMARRRGNAAVRRDGMFLGPNQPASLDAARRYKLESDVQNLRGPINGIEQVSDEDLQALLIPRGYRAVGPINTEPGGMTEIERVSDGPDIMPYVVCACLGFGMGMVTFAVLVGVFG